MVKHTQTISRQKPTNCLSVFDHFVKMALKRLSNKFEMLDLPSQNLGPTKLSGGDFWWGAAIHKIPLPFAHAKSFRSLQIKYTKPCISDLYEVMW